MLTMQPELDHPSDELLLTETFEAEGALSLSTRETIDKVCLAFEDTWKAGQRPQIEQYLGGTEGPGRGALLRALLRQDLFYRRRQGEQPTPEEYAARFPQDQPLIKQVFGEFLARDRAARPPSAAIRRFGDYQLLQEIAHGGMGVVYQARHLTLKRVVALKMIRSGEFASAEEVERFHREAEAAANLQHPNIVAVHEVGSHEGQHYFTMDFVEGRSLGAIVRENPLPAQRAAKYVTTIAEAIQYAHAQGTVHRDMKPANVLIDQADQPRITDFGLAKRISTDARLTATDQCLGTPSYMPPEQVASKWGQVGPLSDVYALGATLYELVTGRPPFRAETPAETLLQVVSDEPVSPRLLNARIPPDLDTICMKCLEKQASQRYSSAQALAEDLRRFVAGEPILARPISRTERLWRWCRRNPRTAGLSAAVALLVVVWAVTASVMAGLLKVQKDQTESARIQADKNAGEATYQAGLAQQNQKKAEHEALIAVQNETRAKETADRTVKQMVDLGKSVHNRLQSKRLSVAAAPEVRRLREDVLAMLRQSLVLVSQKIEAAGTTTFAELAIYQEFGDLLTKLGQAQEAARVHQQGYDLAKRLSEREPNNDLARANWGVMIQRLGDVALDVNGDARSARSHYTEALDLHRQILAHPRSQHRTGLQSKIALSHVDVRLGQALLALGQPAAARESLQEGLTYRQAWAQGLAEADQKSAEPRSYVMEARMWLGIASWHLADTQSMQEHFAQALHIGESLAQQFPQYFPFKADLAEVQGAFGDAQLRSGKVDEAETSYRDSLRNLELVIAHDPDDPSQLALLALTHERLGTVSARLGRSAEAEKHYQEALQSRSEWLQIEPSNVPRQTAYLLALARSGKPVEAAQEAMKLRPRVAHSTELLLQLARCFAMCAAQDAAQKQQHVERALDALRAALGDDYRDHIALQTDPCLEPLHPEKEFQQLIAQVKAR
jgi:eukaryotic-like serine/threonine-protein kinase